jgi:hypothetical protein
MNQKQRSGTLTDADRQQWIDATRKRDLSPSIEAQRIYRKSHPKDSDELTVEIKPDADNEINLEVFSK